MSEHRKCDRTEEGPHKEAQDLQRVRRSVKKGLLEGKGGQPDCGNWEALVRDLAWERY